MTDSGELWQRVLAEGAAWDERLAAASEGVTQPVAPGPGDVEADLAAWRHAVDPDDSGQFAKRLAWQGLDLERARALLRSRGSGADASWVASLERLRQATRTGAVGPADDEAWLAAEESVMPAAAAEFPFAHLWWPSVRARWDELRADLDDAAAALVTENAAAQLQLALLQRLSTVSTRALLEQFGKDRSRGQSMLLSFGVPTDAGRSRYAAFCRAQAAAGLADLLAEFPVLGRILGQVGRTWRREVRRTIGRIAADAHVLTATYGASEPLRLTGVATGAGDSHRGGQTVAILSFAGAGDNGVKVVFKPKDMRIEARYQAVAAAFLDGPNAAPAVRVVPVRDEYGYASYVAHEPPADEAELRAFYTRAGRLLALLHLFGTTDCHHENLIARGPDLVLIDPETLFEGVVTPTDERLEAAVRPAVSALAASVLRMGMLPVWLRMGPPGAPVVDISALGAEQSAEQQTFPGCVNVNTDDMAWGRRTAPAVPMTSLPVAPGAPNPIAQHLDDLIDGFTAGYTDAMEPGRQDWLLAQFAGFAGIRRRVVIRGTKTYAVLQMRALAPERLRSANLRGVELDRLARSSLLADRPGPHWELFGAELHDLEQLDIPYFDYPIGANDIHGTDRVVRDALTGNGLKDADERVRSLSEDDLALQVKLIRASIGARSHRGVATAQPRQPDRARQPDPREAAADGADPRLRQRAVAEMVTALATSSIPAGPGRRSWLALRLVDDGMRMSLDLVGPDLYSGRAGLRAFLDAVAAAAPGTEAARQAARLADESWLPLQDYVAACDDYAMFRFVRDAGLGLAGAGGLLITLALPASRIDPQVGERLRTSVVDAVLANVAEKLESQDVMAGAAGAVGPLVDSCQRGGDDRTREAVRVLADQLAGGQDPLSGGWRPVAGSRPLTGLSHGASGYGLALLRAGALLDEERFVAAGARAFAYERDCYRSEISNWPDFRTGAGDQAMVAWCHGAAGIALARLQALRLLPDHPDADQWRQDLAAGAGTTAQAPLGPFDHLCCGNAGRAAVLAQLAAATGEPGYAAAASRIADQITQRWLAAGRWRLNDFGTGSTAGESGFMTGLPGIGMQLLAMDDPQVAASLERILA